MPLKRFLDAILELFKYHRENISSFENSQADVSNCFDHFGISQGRSSSYSSLLEVYVGWRRKNKGTAASVLS